jgi:hypothetical protein
VDGGVAPILGAIVGTVGIIYLLQEILADDKKGEPQWTKLTTRTVLAVVSWFFFPVASVALGAGCTGYFRSFLVPRADLWGSREILSVGIAWGIIVGVGMSVAIAFATSSIILSLLLYFEGWVAIGFIGYKPAPFDIHKKAEQTSVIAWCCYALVVIIAVAYRALGF